MALVHNKSKRKFVFDGLTIKSGAHVDLDDKDAKALCEAYPRDFALIEAVKPKKADKADK